MFYLAAGITVRNRYLQKPAPYLTREMLKTFKCYHSPSAIRLRQSYARLVLRNETCNNLRNQTLAL